MRFSINCSVYLSVITCCALHDVVAQRFTPYPENHKRLVQGISFINDMSVAYFTLPHQEYGKVLGDNTDAYPRLAIYCAQIENGKWNTPSLVSFSGTFTDYEPSLSPDGSLMFFNTNRPQSGDIPMDKNDIWYSEKHASGWGSPIRLELNTSEYEESYPTITSSGWLYYLAERMIGARSGYGIYETKFNGMETMEGNRLDLVEQPYECGDPWVSPAGDYLIYTRYDPENWNESCDLFISFKKDGKWTNGIALEELSSAGPDFSPTVSPDGKWIYYRKNYALVKVQFDTLLETSQNN